MAVTIPTSLQERAEWWCALNGHQTPPGVELASRFDRSALFNELETLPGVIEAGLALWRARYDRGQYPQTGDPLPESQFGPFF